MMNIYMSDVYNLLERIGGSMCKVQTITKN